MIRAEQRSKLAKGREKKIGATHHELPRLISQAKQADSHLPQNPGTSQNEKHKTQFKSVELAVVSEVVGIDLEIADVRDSET